MTGGRLKALDSPAEYEIRVYGVLAPRWSEYLGGVEIAGEGTPDDPVTVLHGTFQDQAALLGVLNTLYDLGLPLLSFSSIPYPTSLSGTATTAVTSDPANGAG